MNNTLQSHSSNIDNDECSLTDTQILALCKEFASITNTDTTLAKMILQENQWNLERAVSIYFDLLIDETKSSIKEINNQYQNSELNIKSIIPHIELSNIKKNFKLLSWNIDGLDEYALEIRTQGVIDIIKKEEPDVIFLQEVIPTSLKLIRIFLPEYDSYAGNIQGYFVVILTRREMFRIHGFEIIAYPNTNMNRNLLIVHTTYKNSIEIDLMTSHHESGTEELASQQRIEQLKLCFQRMLDAPLQRIVLFGGDLNMREKELRKIGNIPSGICDLWIETGKRNECAYTWDMSINTNNNFPSNTFQPRARFDRLYFRSTIENNIKFQPISFELKGLEKLSSIQRYCSDHWAIQVNFEI
ncbi:unnamed protein product [Rotaria sordida]|uniref:Tyrosyl-DNA phosphodiesterase 2 n=1 Tax=Rotaria sordida TaxID=392033 RepID=A0A814UHW4_9BILA|nr:unnamed protein product [Rotaria sordida]